MVIFAGPPWRKPREEIGRMTRAWVFDVLNAPRRDDGTPYFADEEAAAREWLTRKAEGHGLTGERARAFARRQEGR